MPLKTSEAFVLDARKMREADRLVTFFTEDEGKIRGVAASAAKSRRRFGGKLERLSRVRVTYFEKEGKELARIDSCDLLEESFTLHQDLATAAVLSYMAEVADTFVRERESDRRYFRLLKSLMAALRAGAEPRLMARYFETWTLRLHGLMPELDLCGECGRALGRVAGAAYVEAGDAPVALCGACRRGSSQPGDRRGRPAGRVVTISPAALEAIERFRRLPPAELAGRAPSSSVLSEIETFAVTMLTSFTGHGFRSYGFLRDLGLAEGNPS